MAEISGRIELDPDKRKGKMTIFIHPEGDLDPPGGEREREEEFRDPDGVREAEVPLERERSRENS